MAARLPNVFSISAGAAFLEILADQILAGFPLGDSERPLTDWTILLPTRRAAAAFGEILLKRSKKTALVLPRVRPLGDLDEDTLQDDTSIDGSEPAMSSLASLLEITNLARTWAHQNQHLELAQKIIAGPAQAMNLARSLSEIVITAETHNLTVDHLAQVYELDIAEHRQTITSLLELVLRDLPDLQSKQGMVGATARRHSMIRAEAKRISNSHEGPIIAAGSTGSTPATRELLAAISRHAEGAVILPGLDKQSDEDSWATLKPEHPQFALKTLLVELGINRQDVKTLGQAAVSRNLLASELFRPTETTPRWHSILPALRDQLADAAQGITEIAAPDRHMEARAIACILRETLEHPTRTAALITPDRDLAQRVVAEMARWNIELFDSAAEALSRRGLGAALDLLLQAWLEDFSPTTVMALLRHPLVKLGLDEISFASLVQNFDLAVLRGPLLVQANYVDMLSHARAKASDDHHLHLAVKALGDRDWAALTLLAKAVENLRQLLRAEPGLATQLEAITHALQFAIPPEAWNESSSGLIELLEKLDTEAHRWPDASMFETAALLRQLLLSEKQPPTQLAHSRLAILGTLEARLLPFDVIILGGLNETVWPSAADPGPWLNRSMRDKLGLPLPERDIGMAAHDFEQGYCTPQVYLTWSKRLNHAPQSQSRWLLRMKAVLATAGVTPPEGGHWLALAQSLQNGGASKPVQKPCFAPPVASRPTKFSVTEVEKLFRNPYAIYAKRILKLEPLSKFAEQPDAGLRGSLFHDAIGEWNKKQAPSLDELLLEGEKALSTLGEAPEHHFWVPHFKRLASFLWNEQTALRESLVNIHAEINGKLELDIAGVKHLLTARADRIDVLQNGSARIIDYKTGKIPTTEQVKADFSPQLTLEAAMILEGTFGLNAKSVAELVYFQIGGGKDGLNKKPAVDGGTDEIAKLARQHLQGFKNLLTHYRNPQQPYLPRTRVEKEDDEQDYDHLSRYLEWQLAEQK